MYCENCGKQLNEGEICACGMQQPVYSAQPLAKSKKMSTGKKVAIGIICFVLAFSLAFAAAFTIGFFAGNGILGGGKEITKQLDEKFPDNNFTTENSGLLFTNGAFDSDRKIYKNEWLNLQLTCPDGFEEADAELYDEYAVEDSECVAYFIAEDGDEITIGIGDGSDTEPKEYTAYYHASMETYLRNEYLQIYSEEYLKDLEFKNIFDKVTIGGRDYLLSVTYTQYEENVDIVYCMLCLKLDNKFVEIDIITDTLDECTALINSLTTVK